MSVNPGQSICGGGHLGFQYCHTLYYSIIQAFSLTCTHARTHAQMHARTHVRKLAHESNMPVKI